MKSSQVLMKAKELIATPDAWTKDELAKDAFGVATDPLGPNARCYCSIGATIKANHFYGSTSNTRSRAYLSMAVQELVPETTIPAVSDYNDTHTHEEVMTMFNKAIALAKEDENADQS